MIYKNWKDYYEEEKENATLDCENGADENLYVCSCTYELEFGGKTRENQFYISSYIGDFVRIFANEELEDVIQQLKAEKKVPMDFVKMVEDKVF